jgi:hypothetical protein
MSPRALAGLAVWTATLTGSAFAQSPGGPPAPAGYAHVDGSAPFVGGGRVMADMPPTALPPTAPPTVTATTTLPTDGIFESPAGMPRGPHSWLGIEYLLYWTKNAPLPVPIATAGPASGLGILGTTGTIVVLGNSDYSFNTRSGLRVSGGWWLTENQSAGLEANLFVLPEKTSNTPPMTSASPSLPTLARPFFDTSTNRQNSRLLTRPNTFAGGISTEASNLFWGGQVSGVWRFRDRGWYTVDFLTGFQFLDLEESLNINDFASARAGGTVNFNGQQFNAGVTYLQDHIGTTNRFYGWMIGGRTNFHYEAFTLACAAKIGIGNISQDIRLDGTSTLAGPYPAPQTTGGAFFTTGFNAGKFEQNHTGYMGELSLNLNVQVTSHLSVNFGGNYLVVDGVVRPGDQLSTNINSTQIPIGQNYGARFGPPSSGAQFNTSSFYVQGLNLGFAYGY